MRAKEAIALVREQVLLLLLPRGHKPLNLSFAKSPLVFSWILICIPLTPSFCPFHSAVSKKYSAQWLRLDTLTYSRPLFWYHYGYHFQISSKNMGPFRIRFFRPKLVIHCFGKELEILLGQRFFLYSNQILNDLGSKKLCHTFWMIFWNSDQSGYEASFLLLPRAWTSLCYVCRFLVKLAWPCGL